MSDAAYHTTTLAVSVHRTGASPIFGTGNTIVRVEDEAAGPFVVLEQLQDEGNLVLRMDLEELEIITRTARRLIRAAQKVTP